MKYRIIGYMIGLPIAYFLVDFLITFNDISFIIGIVSLVVVLFVYAMIGGEKKYEEEISM